MIPRTLLALVIAQAVMAQGLDADRLARIAPRMQSFVDNGTAAGFVTLVARRNEVAHLAAVGMQDREAKIPMKTDSIFQIMSMTKPITATGIMMLAEEGRLSISDPVEKHIPEFRGQRLRSGVKPAHPITLLELLTHTSGMPGSSPAGFTDPANRYGTTLADLTLGNSQLPLEFEPGARWQYSNTGIATLGRIVEVVSGMPYDRFMGERIFKPLRMADTFYFPDAQPEAKRARIAAVYTDDGGKLVRATTDLYRKGAKYPMPEGGLYSTASDIARFYRMMLGKGTLDGARVLSPAGVRVMTMVHTRDLTTGFAPGMGYGLGFAVVRNAEGMFRLNSVGTFGHGGAFRTYVWADPVKDLIGVIMYQRTNGGGDVADEISAFTQLAVSALR